MLQSGMGPNTHCQIQIQIGTYLTPSLAVIDVWLTAGARLPADLGELYAFHYNNPGLDDRPAGWTFDLRAEYLRMGVPNDNWVLTCINNEYEVPPPPARGSHSRAARV